MPRSLNHDAAKIIAHNITEEMNKLGLDLRKLAKESTINWQTLRNWTSGDHMPQKQGREQLESYFGLPVGALLRSNDSTAPNGEAHTSEAAPAKRKAVARKAKAKVAVKQANGEAGVTPTSWRADEETLRRRLDAMLQAERAAEDARRLFDEANQSRRAA